MLRAGTYAVGGPGGETGVTDSADLLVTLRIGECKYRLISCLIRIAERASDKRTAGRQKDKSATCLLLPGTIYPSSSHRPHMLALRPFRPEAPLVAHHDITPTHVVLVGQDLQRRLDDSTTQTENQVQGRLLLDVVVAQGSAIFELLSGEDESLLIRGDSLLVLDLFCGERRGRKGEKMVSSHAGVGFAR